MAMAVHLLQQVDDIVAETYNRMQDAENRREREFRAVVCIQSWFRATRVRTYLKFLNSAALSIQRRWRGYRDRDRVRKILVQRVYDMRFQHYTNMAIKIQKTWRGYRSRKYVFSLASRKKYFDILQQKNDLIRQELADYSEKQSMGQRSKVEAVKQNQMQEFLARNHHLVSTVVQPGIYNSPFKETPDEMELRLRSQKAPIERSRNSKVRSQEVTTFDPTWKRYELQRYSPLPPLPDRPMGPFREPSEVQQQRYKPFRPSLRVMSDFYSVDEARQQAKAEEWIGRISDIKYLPCQRLTTKPYEPLLSTTAKFGQIPYGTRYFREEFPDVWLSKNFHSVVPPIPVFDRLNDTYSEGTVA